MTDRVSVAGILHWAGCDGECRQIDGYCRLCGARRPKAAADSECGDAGATGHGFAYGIVYICERPPRHPGWHACRMADGRIRKWPPARRKAV